MKREGAIETPYNGSAWGLIDQTALTAGRHKPPQFPLEVLGPYWSQWVLERAKGTSAPVDYVACSLIPAAAALIGNARNIVLGPDWKEPPILWMCQVGDPSSGKSPALESVMSILRELERELGVGFQDVLAQWSTESLSAKYTLATWEDEVKESVKLNAAPPNRPEGAVIPEKPVLPRLIIMDTTPEALGSQMRAHPKGLLFFRDELSGFFAGFNRYGGNGERALWLETFHGRPYSIDRIKHDEPIQIPRLSASIIGGIQPDRLLTTLFAGDDDGMASRFLYCWPDGVGPQRSDGIQDDGSAGAALRRLMNLSMAVDEYGDKVPTLLSLTEEAADALYKYRVSVHQESKDAAGFYAGHLGKAPGLLGRLALVLTYLWWSATDAPEPRTVSEKGIGFAAHLMTAYFSPMAMRAFGDAARPEGDRHAAAIARRIVKKKLSKINASDIRRKWNIPGLTDAPKVMVALRVLEETNCIRPAPSRLGDTPGRHSSDYEVNPALLEASL